MWKREKTKHHYTLTAISLRKNGKIKRTDLATVSSLCINKALISSPEVTFVAHKVYLDNRTRSSNCCQHSPPCTWPIIHLSGVNWLVLLKIMTIFRFLRILNEQGYDVDRRFTGILHDHMVIPCVFTDREHVWRQSGAHRFLDILAVKLFMVHRINCCTSYNSNNNT